MSTSDQNQASEPHTDAPKNELMEHSYDGIVEYDSPIPGWWHILFLVSIIWAVCYAVFWEMSPIAPTAHRVLAQTELRVTEEKFGSIGTLDPTNADMLVTITEIDGGSWKSMGQSLFQGNCSSCHLADGGGDSGPNLTDDLWINVQDVTDIYDIITEGANKGAMPAWRNNFSDNERVLLAAYVASLRGTTPSRAKGGEGERIDPWPASGNWAPDPKP